jgi:hypothetical protein
MARSKCLRAASANTTEAETSANNYIVPSADGIVCAAEIREPVYRQAQDAAIRARLLFEHKEDG